MSDEEDEDELREVGDLPEDELDAEIMSNSSAMQDERGAWPQIHIAKKPDAVTFRMQQYNSYRQAQSLQVKTNTGDAPGIVMKSSARPKPLLSGDAAAIAAAGLDPNDPFARQRLIQAQKIAAIQRNTSPHSPFTPMGVHLGVPMYRSYAEQSQLSPGPGPMMSRQGYRLQDPNRSTQVMQSSSQAPLASPYHAGPSASPYIPHPQVAQGQQMYSHPPSHAQPMPREPQQDSHSGIQQPEWSPITIRRPASAGAAFFPSPHSASSHPPHRPLTPEDHATGDEDHDMEEPSKAQQLGQHPEQRQQETSAHDQPRGNPGSSPEGGSQRLMMGPYDKTARQQLHAQHVPSINYQHAPPPGRPHAHADFYPAPHAQQYYITPEYAYGHSGGPPGAPAHHAHGPGVHMGQQGMMSPSSPQGPVQRKQSVSPMLGGHAPQLSQDMTLIMRRNDDARAGQHGEWRVGEGGFPALIRPHHTAGMHRDSHNAGPYGPIAYPTPTSASTGDTGEYDGPIFPTSEPEMATSLYDGANASLHPGHPQARPALTPTHQHQHTPVLQHVGLGISGVSYQDRPSFTSALEQHEGYVGYAELSGHPSEHGQGRHGGYTEEGGVPHGVEV